ncbi:thiamine phosphate synthase [Endomicrobium proavitum]|uniref:Thiamine-phosphate synthase n=1 Tax=Endomicrobium proavitum TaxID=1408281 RepID=A0A0G3WJ25_9BACT|nr:thiamine phosphate synthase [Endomicrobium proavitum]AKL97887.1 Thiamine-phosphate synthase [Endomicrobium proavitum]
MSHLRKSFDLSVYFVLGPENVGSLGFREVVKQSIAGGITFLQVRSKVVSAAELADLGRIAAEEIKLAGKENKIALVIDDRVDVAYDLRLNGVKIDGVHLGQSDVSVESARKILGEDAIIGLSARSKDLFEYIKNFKSGTVDYFGAGPLHATATKPDCGLVDGVVVERTLSEIKKLKELSPLPVVVGGGVKLQDLAGLKETKVDGFFVVSAIAGAASPFEAAKKLAEFWGK